MIKKITIIILLSQQLTLLSQRSIDSLILYRTTDTSLLDIQVDALNNLWKIYPNKIARISTDKAYSDTFWSDMVPLIHHIDSKFPLKSLFFNPQKNTISIINSRWGILNQVQLDDINIYQPLWATYSYDEYIWILDFNTNKLSKINENGRPKFNIDNPFQYQSKKFFPQKLFDFKYYAIGVDTSFGLFVIDNFGSLLQTIPIAHLSNTFSINEDLLLVTDSSTLQRFNWNSQLSKGDVAPSSIHIPPGTISIQPTVLFDYILTDLHELIQLKKIKLLFEKK